MKANVKSFVVVLVLLLHGSWALPGQARAEPCDPAEAANILISVGDSDPAFRALAGQLMRWGYGAESTCITERTNTLPSKIQTLTIEQTLVAKASLRQPGRERTREPWPTLRPPYLLRTHVQLGAETPGVKLVDFTLIRRDVSAAEATE